MEHGSRNTLVELDRFTLKAGDKILLHETAARFEPGKVTLIVGPSGAGKSLLLRTIAGLMDRSHQEVHAQGSVKIGGREVMHERGPRSVGVVFQQFALFDELTPSENVRFARAHRAHHRKAVTSDADPAALLAELRVPTNVRTSALSGGQQQRLAIARTLTYNPEVILYDEPTSGLDHATAHHVAALIRSTHDAHPKTSIIVTHDYESLSTIADAVYLLDAESQSLRLIEREKWNTIGDELVSPRTIEEPQSTPQSSALWYAAATVSRLTQSALIATSQALEATLMLPVRLIPLWRSPAWGVRYLLHFLRLVSGFSAWLYVCMIGIIIGFVTTHFTFKFIPYADYTEPLIIEDLLKAVGYALYRILIPIFATVLIAARCGAAVASDVGGKTYGKQVEALRSFGASPDSYLQTNILFAFLLGVPFLTVMCFFVARLTSLIVFAAAYPDLGPPFWSLHFHRQLIMPGDMFYVGTGWMLAKVTCCAAGIGLIAYHIGARPKHSSRAVSSGITTAILWATLYTLVVHFIFAFIEFEKVQ